MPKCFLIAKKKGGISMASIKTLIAITNGATAPIKEINKNVKSLISTTEHLEKTSKNMFDTTSILRAKSEIDGIDTSFRRVTESIMGAGRKQKQFDDSVKNTSKHTDNLYSKMRRLVGAYIGLRGAVMVLNISDNLTEMRARLDIMNDGLQTTEALQKKIMASANRARQKYADTAQVIGKLGITAKNAFKNNDEIIAFAELMNKSFKLGGASASEQTNGMYQLTQAMASGRLQGDEFRSIIENAPLLAQAIAKATGVGMQELKKMSAEGMITSDVIKQALFESADEIEERYKQMPITFHDIWNRIQNGAITAFQPFFEQLSQIAQTEEFYKLTLLLTATLEFLGVVAAKTISILTSGAGFIYDHWDMIEPIFWGLVAAFVALKVATIALTVAQWYFNSALYACPIVWIIVLIAAVIGALLAWLHHTIGLKTAWLITIYAISTGYDWLILSTFKLVAATLSGWYKMQMGIYNVKTGILNALGTMKATGLMIIQGFVNGAIRMINSLIAFVNKIPGVAISTIQEVSFGTQATIKNNAEIAQRNKEAAAYMKQRQDRMKIINDNIAKRENMVNAKKADRFAAIQAAYIEHKTKGKKNQNGSEGTGFDYASMANNDVLKNLSDDLAGTKGNTGGTRDNTGKMKDSLDRAEEDLKYMRDVAEREVIDRTVLRDVTVKVDNNFGDVHETADVDGIIRKIEKQLYDEFEVEPEGVA